jgi:hypothetical protein
MRSSRVSFEAYDARVSDGSTPAMNAWRMSRHEQNLRGGRGGGKASFWFSAVVL